GRCQLRGVRRGGDRLPFGRLNGRSSIAGSIWPRRKKPRSPPDLAVPGSSETSAATFANFSPPTMRLRMASIFTLPALSAAESGSGEIWITCRCSCGGALGELFLCGLVYASAPPPGTRMLGGHLLHHALLQQLALHVALVALAQPRLGGVLALELVVKSLLAPVALLGLGDGVVDLLLHVGRRHGQVLPLGLGQHQLLVD